MTFANEFVYVLGVNTVQISVLCFYLRLFNVHKVFAKVVYALIAVVICWCLAVFFSSLFQCSPVSFAWAKVPHESHCLNYRAWLIGTNIPHVFIDFSILCLPLHQIWKLSLSRMQKIGLSSIFLLGIFTSVISIVRTYFNASIRLSGPTWDFTPVQLWSALEAWVGVVCVSLPPIAPLVRFICGGRRFGKYRGTYHQTAGPQPIRSSRRNKNSSFSMQEDQVELFENNGSNTANTAMARSQQSPNQLQNIFVTTDFEIRNDTKT